MALPDDDSAIPPLYARELSPLLRLRNIVTPGLAHQRESSEIFGSRPPYPLLADRPDVLVFETDLLREPLEITGRVAVQLWIASTAPDTDFTAKLVDVYPANEDYPEGYHMGLCDSVIRCRYREGWDREVMMTPDEAYCVDIVLPPTSNVFAADHRIRIDISSSNFPRLELNPNTGEPMGKHTHSVSALQTVFADPSRPSHVILPVIPAPEG
jgi:putative CocE/NonD family hydrolase